MLCAEQSHSEELFNNNVARAGNRYRSGHSDHSGHIEALTRSVRRVFIARGQPAAPRRRRLFAAKVPGMHVRATAFDARCAAIGGHQGTARGQRIVVVAVRN